MLVPILADTRKRNAAVRAAAADAITADVERRAAEGLLREARLGSSCEVLRRAGTNGERLVCFAATSGTFAPNGERVQLGYEFLTAANTATGACVSCTTTPRAARGIGGAAPAEVPLDPGGRRPAPVARPAACRRLR